MAEITGYYPTRAAFYGLLRWYECMCEVFPGEYPLTDEEVTFIASLAEVTGGLETGRPEDAGLFATLLAEYEAAHGRTDDKAAVPEFDRTVEEIKAILRARFGTEVGESIYDTLEYHAMAREELMASPGPRSLFELTVVTERLRKFVPKLFKRIEAILQA